MCFARFCLITQAKPVSRATVARHAARRALVLAADGEFGRLIPARQRAPTGRAAVRMVSMTTTTTMAAAGADPRSAIAPITCDTTGTREKALASLLEQIMDSYSVSDDEKPLADAVEAFLRSKPHLTVHRHGDTVVASTSLGRPRRVVLAGHLDTVPVIDNFPPKLLEPAALAGARRPTDPGGRRRGAPRRAGDVGPRRDRHEGIRRGVPVPRRHAGRPAI